MAIGTAHALVEHPALQEGPVFIILVQYLPIGMVDGFAQEFERILIGEFGMIAVLGRRAIRRAWQRAQAMISRSAF